LSHEHFLIVDLGSQYAQLIARRVREQNCYAEIVMPDVTPTQVKEAKGVILSGSPWSAYDEKAPKVDPELFRQGTPVLGICYGMQLMCALLGGEVGAAHAREYGPARIHVRDRGARSLFAGLGDELDVWMSHGDRVEQPPEGFVAIAETPSAPYAAIRSKDARLFGVQFHPEVTHTPRGPDILYNFLFGICGASGDWRMSAFVDEATRKIREQVGEDRVICGLSGGVDSSVAAVLIHRAIGDRLTCIFVDNGFLRKGEAEEVQRAFRDRFQVELVFADEAGAFIDDLAGVTEPEEKRRRIGHRFVKVFEERSRDVADAHWLAQGTLYPDVIESQSAFGGPSATIKTHHNVGGLPEKLGFKLLEPFRDLFKDEVRAIGRELDVPASIVDRQPFPGPGLAVRIAGEVTRERLGVLREADAVVRQEIEKAGAHQRLWQYFAVLVPVKTVGVMGDERTYEHVIAVRAVESTDAMTADWADLGKPLLTRISNRIINEVRGVNRVVYDISTKPPSTIEWE
jgi:GMP synthase (glutamine-hydrolysing)